MKYFEDFAVGDVYELGSRTVTAEDIVAFARKYDPQPFHLDEQAARESFFGGLAASGWHTSAIGMAILSRVIVRENWASLGQSLRDWGFPKPDRRLSTMLSRSMAMFIAFRTMTAFAHSWELMSMSQDTQA